MKDNIVDNVPHSLRFNGVGADIAGMAALSRAGDFDSFDDAVDFAAGAANLQKTMNGEFEDIKSGVFPLDPVVDVRFFIRKSPKDPDRVLGTKARVYGEGTKYKSDKIETQGIDTDFFTGGGFGNMGDTFNGHAAVTNANAATFLALNDKNGLIRKVTDKTGDTPTRYAAGVAGPYGHPVFYSYDPLVKTLPDASASQRAAIMDAMANLGTTYHRGEQLKPFALSQRILKAELGADVQKLFVEKIKEMRDDEFNLDDADSFDRMPGINIVPFVEAVAEII